MMLLIVSVTQGALKWIEQFCCHQFRSENSITVFRVSFFKHCRDEISDFANLVNMTD